MTTSTTESSSATLHTFNASPFEQRALFERLLQFASAGDAVLLIENGVYALQDATALQQLNTMQLNVYALEADVQARGLHTDRMPATTTLIDDSGFVALSCAHRKVMSWFL
jgi:tRNA 2-thiouridine synthesizing protein B